MGRVGVRGKGACLEGRGRGVGGVHARGLGVPLPAGHTRGQGWGRQGRGSPILLGMGKGRHLSWQLH